MANNIDGPEITLKAYGDLSAYQFHIMKVGTDGKANLATDPDDHTACMIGILQNKPDAADEPAVVRIEGVAKVVGGATIAAGTKVTCDGDGHLAAAVSGDNVIGIALETAGSTKITQILLCHGSTISDA